MNLIVYVSALIDVKIKAEKKYAGLRASRDPESEMRSLLMVDAEPNLIIRTSNEIGRLPPVGTMFKKGSLGFDGHKTRIQVRRFTLKL